MQNVFHNDIHRRKGKCSHRNVPDYRSLCLIQLISFKIVVCTSKKWFFKYLYYYSLDIIFRSHVVLCIIYNIFRLPFIFKCFEYQICQILWLKKQCHLYFVRNLLMESAWWILLGSSFSTPCTRIILQVLYKIPTSASTLWSIVLFSPWIMNHSFTSEHH